MQEFIAQLLQILKGAWRHRWPAVATAWAVALLGWIVVQIVPDKFEARTQVYVDAESLLKPLLKDIAVQRDVMSQVAMMQSVMLSRPNLEKVARANDLFLKAETRKEQEEVLDTLEKRIRLASGAPRPGAPGDANTFNVTFEDKSPKIAHGVVQSLLDTFMEDSLGMKRDDAGVAQRFLLAQLREYERKLLESEARLADFKRGNVGAMPGNEGGYYQRLDVEMSKLEQLGIQARQLTERRDELARQIDGEEPTFGLMGSSVGGGSSPIDGQIANYQARLDELEITYTEKHPEVMAIRATIERLQEEKQRGVKLSSSVAPPGAGPRARDAALVHSIDANPVYQNMRIALSQADANLAEIRGQLAAQQSVVANLRSRVDAIPQVEAELARLDRDYSVNKSQYDALLQRLESARISESADQSTDDVKFRVIEPPVVPLKPSAPNRALFNSLVLLVALAAGLGLAYLMQQLRPTFATRDSLRVATGLPVLGTITAAVTETLAPWTRRQSTAVAGALGMLLVMYALNLVFSESVRATLRGLVG